MSKLQDIMNSTGMTREQIINAVGTGLGALPPSNISGERLAQLYDAMRRYREMRGGFAIDTPERAGLLRRLIKKHSPVDTGALKDSWDDPATVQIMPDGSVEIDNPLPYARIQDLGGIIHRTTSEGKAYTIRIPAQHYVRKAINEYNASLAGQIQPLPADATIGETSVGLSGLIARGLALVRGLT